MIESYNQSTDSERRFHIKYWYEYVNVIIKVLIMSKGTEIKVLIMSDGNNQISDHELK